LTLQAESVAHHLRVPVLLHSVKKPGCSSTIINYFKNKPAHLIATFPAKDNIETSTGPSRSPASPMPVTSSVQPSELVVIGDRILTDVVLGNRLGALSIWTTGLWERELMSMRYFEYCLVGIMDIWDKCVSSPKWKRNRRQPGDIGRPKPLTPQELFTRVLPPSPPSTMVRIARAFGRRSIALYRGAKTVASWTVRRWTQRRKRAATNQGEHHTDAAQAAQRVNNSLHIRMISASRRGLSFPGSKLARAIISNVMNLIRPDRMQDAFTRIRRFPSTFRTSLRRLRARSGHHFHSSPVD
jgi:predicted HAD superfamily phosphohydrolase YqeG